MNLKQLVENQNKIFFNFLFIILSMVLLTHFYDSFFSRQGNTWAFNELFINYSGGFMKRGILGEIFIILNQKFYIQPHTFFALLFMFLHSLQVLLLYKLIYPYKNSKILILLIILSPVLILFNVYDLSTYFIKDNFAKVAILIHAFFIVKKVYNLDSLKKYNNFLNYFIIPLMFFNILNHEVQVFFISIHMLLTLLVNYNYGNSKNFKCLKVYLILLLPFLLILLTPNSWEKVGLINDSIREFGVRIDNNHAGNINLAIGAFIKWHFMKTSMYDHGVDDFFNLFICILLSVILFYYIFHYLLVRNVYLIHPFIKKYYLIFFIPCLITFIPVFDHGRTLNILATHYLAFYFALKVDSKKFNTLFKNFNNLFFFKNTSYIFCFFYIFLWYMPLGGGYDGTGTFSTGDSIIRSTLMNELINIFMIIYNYIDVNIISLPKVIVTL